MISGIDIRSGEHESGESTCRRSTNDVEDLDGTAIGIKKNFREEKMLKLISSGMPTYASTDEGKSVDRRRRCIDTKEPKQDEFIE
jgi:hypothetical protein